MFPGLSSPMCGWNPRLSWAPPRLWSLLQQWATVVIDVLGPGQTIFLSLLPTLEWLFLFIFNDKKPILLVFRLVSGCPCSSVSKESDCSAGEISWSRKWQPTPVSLPGKSHGQWSLVGCSSWGHKELGMTEWLILTYLLRSVSELVSL